MNIPQDLVSKGFTFSEVNELDFNDYFAIKKICYEKYVDEYFGGWVDEVQFFDIRRNCISIFDEVRPDYINSVGNHHTPIAFVDT